MSEPMRRNVLVTLVVGAALLVGCSSGAKTTTTRTTVWPAACSATRNAFSNMIIAGANAANSSRDSLNHWTDVWNGVTSGRIVARSAQYEALMAEFRKDSNAATAAYALQRQHFASFSNVYDGCNQARLPAVCASELKLMMTMAQHEVLESQVSADAFKGGADESTTWNARPRNMAAVNAAVARYNAARDRMGVLSNEHNKLIDQYNALQGACNKAVEAL